MTSTQQHNSPTGNVIITGASSGIGKALAIELAKRGYRLGLAARRLDVLEQVKREILAEVPNAQPVEVATLDVANDETVHPALVSLANNLGGVDIVIANAGITATKGTGKGDFATDRQVIQVNLIGAMATVDAAARIFRASGGGHIVGMSSVSAWVGIPGSGAYSSSKAGFTNYLKAVRAELRKKNIKVTTIHPGFINTDIAEGMDKKPFVIDADKAAIEMANAIQKQKENVIVPSLPWSLVTKLMSILPEKFVAKAL